MQFRFKVLALLATYAMHSATVSFADDNLIAAAPGEYLTCLQGADQQRRDCTFDSWICDYHRETAAHLCECLLNISNAPECTQRCGKEDYLCTRRIDFQYRLCLEQGRGEIACGNEFNRGAERCADQAEWCRFNPQPSPAPSPFASLYSTPQPSASPIPIQSVTPSPSPTPVLAPTPAPTPFLWPTPMQTPWPTPIDEQPHASPSYAPEPTDAPALTPVIAGGNPLAAQPNVPGLSCIDSATLSWTKCSRNCADGSFCQQLCDHQRNIDFHFCQCEGIIPPIECTDECAMASYICVQNAVLNQMICMKNRNADDAAVCNDRLAQDINDCRASYFRCQFIPPPPPPPPLPVASVTPFPTPAMTPVPTPTYATPLPSPVYTASVYPTAFYPTSGYPTPSATPVPTQTYTPLPSPTFVYATPTASPYPSAAPGYW